MELHLSMTWIPKQEEKYSGTASLKALLPFLYSDPPKLGTTVGHLPSLCWNSREATTAACSLLFQASRRNTGLSEPGTLCRLLCRNEENCELQGKLCKWMAESPPARGTPAREVPLWCGKPLIRQGCHLTRRGREITNQKPKTTTTKTPHLWCCRKIFMSIMKTTNKQQKYKRNKNT